MLDKAKEDLNCKYDFFITVSDQVSNPSYKEKSSVEYLAFALKWVFKLSKRRNGKTKYECL